MAARSCPLVAPRAAISLATDRIVVYARRNGLGYNRLGFTVTSKVGKAVTRNRVRRRLRAIYRLHEGGLNPGFDIVIVARTRAASATYQKLEAETLAACRKLGLCAT